MPNTSHSRPTENPELACPKYHIEFALTDFGNPYDPAPPVAVFDDLASDTGDLYAFKDLDYADIGSALTDLLGVLEDVDDVDTGFAELNTPIPAIGKSISELLSLVDGFEQGLRLDEPSKHIHFSCLVYNSG